MQYQICPQDRVYYKGAEGFPSGKQGSKEGSWISLLIEMMHKQALDVWVGILQAKTVHAE